MQIAAEKMSPPQVREVLTRRTFQTAEQIAEFSGAVILDKSGRIFGDGLSSLQQLRDGKVSTPIDYVNIGREKVDKVPPLCVCCEIYQKHQHRLKDIQALTTRSRLVSVFGGENIITLEEKMHRWPSGTIGVYDEIHSTGESLKLAEQIFSTLDPERQFRFGYIIATDQDKKIFQAEEGYNLPWYPYASTRMDVPNNPGSFESIPQTDEFMDQAHEIKRLYLEMIRDAHLKGYSAPELLPPAPAFGSRFMKTLRSNAAIFGL